MASKVQICNYAIGHLGIGKQISSLDERSQEANSCKQFYDLALEQLLRKFEWPFATKLVTLGLVEEDPNDEWHFSYRYPSDCVEFRRILSGQRRDTFDSKVPYRIAQDVAGRLIYSDSENAQGEYTFFAEDVLQYPVDFTITLSYLLASYIAPQITHGDSFNLGDKMLQRAMAMGEQATAKSANEEASDINPESEFIRARDS